MSISICRAGIMEELYCAFDTKNGDMCSALILSAARHVESIVQASALRYASCAVPYMQEFGPYYFLKYRDYCTKRFIPGYAFAGTNSAEGLIALARPSPSTICGMYCLQLCLSARLCTQVWAFESMQENVNLSDLVCKKLERKGYALHLCSLLITCMSGQQTTHLLAHGASHTIS